jgi:hypothetical protein
VVVLKTLCLLQFEKQVTNTAKTDGLSDWKVWLKFQNRQNVYSLITTLTTSAPRFSKYRYFTRLTNACNWMYLDGAQSIATEIKVNKGFRCRQSQTDHSSEVATSMCETFCQKREIQLIQNEDCNYMPEV